MSIFFPEYDCNSVYDIDFENFFEIGYRGVIFDIDNTLSEHGKAADKNIVVFFESLHNMGFKTYLLSNNKEKRVSSFAFAVNSPYIAKANKPFIKSYNIASKNMGLSKEKVLFVGDQIFTDILGANLSKLTSILVRPIHKKEEIQIRLKRIPENLILYFYNLKKKN